MPAGLAERVQDGALGGTHFENLSKLPMVQER